MKKQQSDKYEMYGVIKERLTSTPSEIIAEMPAAAGLIVQFDEALVILKKYYGVQISKTKGHTEKKTALRISMITKMLAVSSCVKAYAMNNDLIVLFTEMDRTYKFFTNSSAYVCSTCCKNLLKKALQLLPQLQAYGLTALILEELDNSIEEYIKYIPQPRVQITNRKVATKGIASMVKSCDEILDKIDVLVDMLTTRRPAFHQSYFADRNIIDSGSRVLSIRGFISDASGNGIGKVTISVQGNKRTRKSSEKGNFQMKNLGNGVYQLTFKKSGYFDVVIDVAVVKGERTEVKVVMEKLDLRNNL